MVLREHIEAVLNLWEEARETTVHSLCGNCMKPMLYDGDRVVVLHGPRDLRFGEVIVVQAEGRYLVQRIIRITIGRSGPLYTVRGDRYSRVHHDVPTARIVGKVGGVRRGKRIQSLDSFPWRTLGMLLAFRSLIACRREENRPWWKLVRFFHEVRLRLLPVRWSITLLPFRAVCWIHRLVVHGPQGRSER
jgi:hypothetical protein